jgi:hypothetical protein
MMRRLLIAIFILALALPGWAQAQGGGEPRCSEEEINGAIEAAQTALAAAQGADALTVALKVSQDLTQLYARCRPVQGEIATATGTRTDPIPLGQYYEFNKGLARIVAVEDPYSYPGNLYGLDEGMRPVSLTLEYVCQENDPNKSCDTSDFFAGDVVLVGGVVVDREFLMSREDLQPPWSGEVFAGNTLAGVDYLAVPQDAQIEAFRMFVSFDRIYFSPQ